MYFPTVTFNSPLILHLSIQTASKRVTLSSASIFAVPVSLIDGRRGRGLHHLAGFEEFKRNHLLKNSASASTLKAVQKEWQKEIASPAVQTKLIKGVMHIAVFDGLVTVSKPIDVDAD